MITNNKKLSHNRSQIYCYNIFYLYIIIQKSMSYKSNHHKRKHSITTREHKKHVHRYSADPTNNNEEKKDFRAQNKPKK